MSAQPGGPPSTSPRPTTLDPAESISAGTRPLALVTGASSGIGLALADELAVRGHDLVIASDEDEIHAVAATLLVLHDVRVDAVQVDLATERGVAELADQVVHRPELDVVCLNAGIGVRGPFTETDLAQHLAVIDLDVRGAVQLAGLALPAMTGRGHGHLLLTSSIAAHMAGPLLSTYAASKRFLLAFAEALHLELEPTGVVVTALGPGATDTRFFGRAHLEDSRLASAPKDDPAVVACDALDALFAGEAKVIAGPLRNALLAGACEVLPDALVGRAHAAQVRARR